MALFTTSKLLKDSEDVGHQRIADYVRDIEFYGWKLIKSDAHAAHLLRRELKHHAKWQQRNKDMAWDYRQLLRIKKGNWYTFMKNRKNRYCSILIWERKE